MEFEHPSIISPDWTISGAAEFLGLTPDDARLIELRIALVRMLRSRNDSPIGAPGGAGFHTSCDVE